MTHEEVMEQVKDKIKRAMSWKEEDLEGQSTEIWLERKIDHILSILEILIKDPDQSLPYSDVPVITNYTQEYNEIYRQAQRTMLKEHWVKVMPK